MVPNFQLSSVDTEAAAEQCKQTFILCVGQAGAASRYYSGTRVAVLR